jgi:hypothetical protein
MGNSQHVGEGECEVVREPFLGVRVLDVDERMLEVHRRTPRHGWIPS